MAFVCLKKDCHKEFKTAPGRSKHHKKCSKESIEKQYRVISGSYHCKRCDNQFKHVESWYRHYKIAHRVEERKIQVKDKVIHKCTICSKAFGKKRSMVCYAMKLFTKKKITSVKRVESHLKDKIFLHFMLKSVPV